MEIIQELFIRVCEDVATPRALSLAVMARKGMWRELTQIKCEPFSYTDPAQYFLDVCVTDLLRKCRDLPTGVNTAEVAVDNFFVAEGECAKANARLNPLVHQFDVPEAMLAIVADIRKDILSIIGPAPSFDDHRGRFGPGATFGDKGKLTTVADKMMSLPTTTSWSIPVRWGWAKTAWARALAESPAGCHLQTSRGNRFTTVPKDATKDRGICIEPSINLFYQLALGGELRAKLRSSGLDLLTAQELHKSLAQVASRTGELATVDLSNASDCMSIALIRLLLPWAWFIALEELRSRQTFLKGKWVLLNKFSSMGNGFTFELETLVFWAIARWCCRAVGVSQHLAKAYGDDILIPTEAAPLLLSALRYFGFTPNPKKTFVTGSFRESCGGDFFLGYDVRPFYLKEVPKNPQEWFAFANGVQLLRAKARALGITSDPFRRLWFGILDQIPTKYRRLRGPKELGDAVIHDLAKTWNLKTVNCIHYVRGLHFVPDCISWTHFRPAVVLACALYGAGDERGGKWPVKGLTPRSPSGSLSVKWFVTLRVTDE